MFHCTIRYWNHSGNNNGFRMMKSFAYYFVQSPHPNVFLQYYKHRPVLLFRSVYVYLYSYRYFNTRRTALIDDNLEKNITTIIYYTYAYYIIWHWKIGKQIIFETVRMCYYLILQSMRWFQFIYILPKCSKNC